MAENLRYNIEGSCCYDNDEANCQKYGRLYKWKAAKKACPAGWHLPSREEWQTLVDCIGGDSVAGGYLKSKSGWYDNGNGTDEFDFSALPGGYHNSKGSFHCVGDAGCWWTSTANWIGQARGWDMLYNHVIVVKYYIGIGIGNSVRCVKD
jgi:uncharacterized protein (TIGR02145 family)